jgi:hypothetical protein
MSRGRTVGVWLWAGWLAACGTHESDLSNGKAGPAEAVAPADNVLVDIADATGLDFVHWNGMTGELYYAEVVGGGAALFDADGDGDLDVYLAQGADFEPGAAVPALPVFPRPAQPGGRLFRNDLSIDNDGRRLRFTDVTEGSGLRAEGYGMGVASGDFDGDGRVDLYLTHFGSNQLWRNVSSPGHIAFVDVTSVAGVDDPRWSTSASFADLDGDGWLDLFVTNYVDFTLARHKHCRSAGGRPDYCGPQSYAGESDRLFRNRGDGTFEDVTGTAGISAAASSGLGVVTADLDRDGRLDVYVANDLQPNFFWRRLDRPGLAFEEVAFETGSAVSTMGRAQASMGVVAADFDGDADDDLFMTHLGAETNTLYVNDGEGFFDDGSAASQLGPASLESTGFGTVTVDLDNDGWLDLFVANGAVKLIEEQARDGSPLPLAERNQLFRNMGDGRFEEISGRAGEALSHVEVSRGVALGDVDNDGRSDLLVTNNSGPARLLHNRSSEASAWVGLRLVRNGRDALGARVSVRRADGSILWRRVATDGSYLCASDPRVLVGLGAGDGPVVVRAAWGQGEVEEWRNLETRRYHTLTAGTGQRVEEPGTR